MHIHCKRYTHMRGNNTFTSRTNMRGNNTFTAKDAHTFIHARACTLTAKGTLTCAETTHSLYTHNQICACMQIHCKNCIHIQTCANSTFIAKSAYTYFLASCILHPLIFSHIYIGISRANSLCSVVLIRSSNLSRRNSMFFLT